MKVKVAEATGTALDWMVAVADGHEGCKVAQIKANGPVHLFRTVGYDPLPYVPSTDWAQGGPIIEQGKIRVEPWLEGKRAWGALEREYQGWANPSNFWVFGPTPLIAVCRCYVASKLGDEVDVPEELMK